MVVCRGVRTQFLSIGTCRPCPHFPCPHFLSGLGSICKYCNCGWCFWQQFCSESASKTAISEQIMSCGQYYHISARDTDRQNIQSIIPLICCQARYITYKCFVAQFYVRCDPFCVHLRMKMIHNLHILFASAVRNTRTKFASKATTAPTNLHPAAGWWRRHQQQLASSPAPGAKNPRASRLRQLPTGSANKSRKIRTRRWSPNRTPARYASRRQFQSPLHPRASPSSSTSANDIDDDSGADDGDDGSYDDARDPTFHVVGTVEPVSNLRNPGL